VIDLHLHTTASDGRSTPAALVQEVAAAGVRILAVTDHDTVAAVADVARAAGDAGLICVPGIEITAVDRGRDIHVLGYFIDPGHQGLAGFLERQRAQRRRRLAEIGQRLNGLGVAIDAASLAMTTPTGRSIGRPQVAAALVAAGHATSIADAFDRYLGEGRPAFVERIGKPPVDVIQEIKRAGGLASLAHPGKVKRDEIIPSLVAGGLDAIEVFHPDHDDTDRARYLSLARNHELLLTGGSDYHGPQSGRVSGLGRVGLPADAYEALVERAARSRA
jgi:predicted metal-dependent phosphoesterase TrpH